MNVEMDEIEVEDVAVPLDGNQLFDLRQAGEALGLSKNAVWRYIRLGKIKGVRLGGAWRVGAEELRRIQREGF